MVKVIEGPINWKLEFSCTGCAARLEAGIEDVEWAWFGPDLMRSPDDKRYYVTCPCCEADNFLKKEAVTPWVVQKAKQYRGRIR